MEGDTQKDLVLNSSPSMVVREYLVENFGFDDSQLQDSGMGNRPTRVGCRLGYGADLHLSAGTEMRRTSKYRPRFNPNNLRPTGPGFGKRKTELTGVPRDRDDSSVTVRKSW